MVLLDIKSNLKPSTVSLTKDKIQGLIDIIDCDSDILERRSQRFAVKDQLPRATPESDFSIQENERRKNEVYPQHNSSLEA